MYQKRYEDRNKWLSQINKKHAKGPSCQGCPLQHVGASFSGPTGTGRNGILLVGSFLDETEAEQGTPFKGEAGAGLSRVLSKIGLKRDDFLVTTVIRCNPPDEDIVGEPYELGALDACTTYLDKLLKDNPQIKVIMPMGNIATKHILGAPHASVYGFHGTVHWHAGYGRWVIPTLHTGLLVQTGFKETSTIISDMNTAFEVIRNPPFYEQIYDFIKIPTAQTASTFVEDYQLALQADPNVVLSVDIETPYSADIDEEDKDGEDSSWTIERISFCFRGNHAITMPWCEPFTTLSRKLLSGTGTKLFWNGNKFDVPRLRNDSCDIGGLIIDGMDAFHFLYSDLPKGLAYATPFFARHMPWKHLSGSNMPFYSCLDALAAWDCLVGIRQRLEKDNLWHVFIRDFVQLEPTFGAMSAVGIGLDQAKRTELRNYYIDVRDNSAAIIQKLMPEGCLPLLKKGGFKGAPADVRTAAQLLYSTECPEGNWKKLKKPDKTALLDRAFMQLGYIQLYHDDADIERRWNRRESFNANSSLQIQEYIKLKYGREALPRNKKDKNKVTTGAEELNRLAVRKNDKILFTILDSSSANDKLTTVLDNWAPGADGRVHTTYTNKPATFRLSSVRPNSQNFPHRSEEADKMREMVIAGDAVDDDWYIVEADYSGIEAIQVGHYAADPDYIRMAKLGVHSFYAASLPQINIHLDPKWDDVQLAAGIKDVKKLAKSINSEGTETPIYDVAKRIVHGSNYWMLEGLMHDSYPESFPTRAIAKQYQDRYFELFPKIRPWQLSVCQQADDQNCLINDFGYRRWFWNAMKWMYNNRLGKWEYVPSGDAKKAVATLPQSSAAAIIRRAMLSSAFQELVAQQLAMLQIHDSLVCRARSHQVEFVKQKLTEAMIYPIAEQGGLTIPIEIKVGKTWRGYDKLKCPLGMKEV